MEAKAVVTISRQLGCGGAEVGQLVAARLGFHYADREILHLAAQALEVEDEELSWRDEKPATIWDRIAGLFPYGLPDAPYTAPPIRQIGDDELYALESRIIEELAARENCVVVGRCGAHVLGTHPGAVHVLLHAPAEYRTQRVLNVYHPAGRQDAVATIQKSDAERQAYHIRLGHYDWLDATNYHLSLNTGAIPLETTADLIAQYLRARIAG